MNYNIAQNIIYSLVFDETYTTAIAPSLALSKGSGTRNNSAIN